MIEMKAKIERAIYEASMALDNNNWAGWLSLCDEEFNYKITAFSPEINKDMIYFEHNKVELANLLDMLPKHNTDHSPLFRHTSVYTVDVSESGTEARATSSVVVFQNMLDGVNSHHIVEACFKAFSRALRMATEIDPRRAGAIPSSKGVLEQAGAN